ncbi:hypothetical protein J0383_05280 [Flavobacterium endoglycinae]|uniref:Uncharacterized protein n=1 Tax=Flavobacterium endoglycinae TaxID=2816357 RepID=A0ABX7QH08_9FLAO|nr:hypothetical protein [Flavobacterium endoglycinae]QSW90232.1 hypothetical protein J0383_05280 [Flavobacterium endoglycinae]
MGNHIYRNGEWIFISSITIKDKSFQELHAVNLIDKFWGSNKNLDLKYPVILDLLKEIIPEKASKNDVMDIELTTEETLGIKNIFEREIKHILTIRKPAKDGYNIIVFDKEIKVDTRNQGVTDGRLTAFNDIYLITKECLDENKPMYLSID